jgi:threonine/homoserine/homoserine lactone efflux protein
MIEGAIWNGFVMGLGLSFSFGPVFFLLIQTSIDKGWRESLIFDAGVLISDLIIIAVAMMFIFSLGIDIDFQNPAIKFWSTMLGAAILLIFGAVLVLNPKKDTSPNNTPELNQVAKLSSTSLFFKGLGINFLNPSVFLIWFGAVPAVAAGFDGKMDLVLTFFASTLVSYFVIDLGKIYAARKLKRFLTPRAITLFHRISGIIFWAIAAWLIYRFFLNA